MRFDLSHDLDWPAPLLVDVLRNRPGRLAAYLAKVDRIEPLELEEPGTERRRWVAPVSALPPIVQSLWPHQTFSWVEHARWSADEREMVWRQVLEKRPEAVTATGSFRFEEDGDETIVWVEGELRLHLDRVQGVPPTLARRGASLERAVFEVLRPNFRLLMAALDQLLTDER